MKTEKPTLYVIKERVIENIRRMADKAEKSGVLLRPHFKTHQSIEIGRLFNEEGIRAITVSSPQMAEKFAGDGWRDITIAVPLNPNCADTYNRLADAITLNLLTDSPEAVNLIGPRLDSPVMIWIEIDTGQHRTGIEPSEKDKLLETVEAIHKQPLLMLKGLLTHAGHSYQVREGTPVRRRSEDSNTGGPVKNDKSTLDFIYRGSASAMQKTVLMLQEEGYGRLGISVGDTPTCSRVEKFYDVNEVRPGNFVFFDLMQSHIGSCEEEHIALAVLCPIISKSPARSEVVVHGGAVHLSKESLEWKGHTVHGRVAELEGASISALLSDTYVKDLSQEHGVIKAPRDWVESKQIGDTIAVIPVHSCLAVDALGAQYMMNTD